MKKFNKVFFATLTTVGAALALSLSASASGLGQTDPIDPNVDPVKTGDNSTAAAAVIATAGVAALGTAIVATKMKKASK